MVDCCIFKNAGDSMQEVNTDRMSIIKVFDYGDRHIQYLYRCPDCGRLVFYKCEVVADFMSFDDHEDYYETLFPVESMEEAQKIREEYPFGGFPGGRPSFSRMRCSRYDDNWPWTYEGV